jgi:hypothetical protein
VTTEPKCAQAILGFRVKSGWATVVLLAGPLQSPQVLDERIVELCDPTVPESRQPYHAGMGKLETDELTVSRRVQIVRHCTNDTVAQLIKDYLDRNWKVAGAGLVVGSTIEPSTIANPHIRAHALEGRLFRTVLDESLSRLGVSSRLVVERGAYVEAAALLAVTEVELKQKVASLGAGQTGPWRADQKLAALVAWMALTHASAGVIAAKR